MKGMALCLKYGYSNVTYPFPLAHSYRRLRHVLFTKDKATANNIKASLGGGGGDSTKFYTGKGRPEVQPLPLLYTILTERYLFCIPSFDK